MESLNNIRKDRILEIKNSLLELQKYLKKNKRHD